MVFSRHLDNALSRLRTISKRQDPAPFLFSKKLMSFLLQTSNMATTSIFRSDNGTAGRGDLCLLALDGGGVRGLSSLMLLKHLMELIDHQNIPKPCDFFDMIGGTSTGGLIAIMLGRLRMTIDECIDEYLKLSPKIFTKVKHRVKWPSVIELAHKKIQIQGRFDHDALEKGVKELLLKRGLPEDALLKEDPSAESCKV